MSRIYTVAVEGASAKHPTLITLLESRVAHSIRLGERKMLKRHCWYSGVHTGCKMATPQKLNLSVVNLIFVSVEGIRKMFTFVCNSG